MRVSVATAEDLLIDLANYMSPLLEQHGNMLKKLSSHKQALVQYEDRAILSDNAFSEKVQEVRYLANGYIYRWRGVFDHLLFWNITCSYSVTVALTEKDTYVFLNSFHLPEYLQGKGIFSGFVTIIKDFLVRNNLPLLIGMTDSSDGRYSSGEIVWKCGLDWDPFLATREGLYPVKI